MRRALALLLTAGVLVVLACGKERVTAWQTALDAYTAEGWTAHGEAYRALLAEPRSRDGSGRLRYAWATGSADRLQNAAPLLLDILVKQRYDPSAKADALTVIPRVAGSAGPRLPALLLDGSRADSGNDLPTRRLLARALARIAGPEIAPQPMLEALEESVAAEDRELSRLHLETVSRSASLLTKEEDRLVVVEDLLDLFQPPTLRKEGSPEPVEASPTRVVGESYLIQRIARIGGRTAAGVVLEYLNKKADPTENEWGVDLAGRLPYSDALGEYLLAGLEGRQPAFHADPVSRRQAVNAVRDLVRRYDTGEPLDRKTLGRIFGLLTRVDESGFTGDVRLSEMYQLLRQELDDALGN